MGKFRQIAYHMIVARYYWFTFLFFVYLELCLLWALYCEALHFAIVVYEAEVSH